MLKSLYNLLRSSILTIMVIDADVTYFQSVIHSFVTSAIFILVNLSS